MDVAGAAQLIEATAKLIGVTAWPAAIVYVLVRFGSNIGDLVSNLGEMNFKGTGFEAALKVKKTEAGAALVAAASKEGATPVRRATAAKQAASAVEGLNATIWRKLERSLVLWVDDSPDNNQFEREAFEAVNINCVISTSTDDALSKLETQHFDLIISDMGRPPDARAGYTLLDKLRSSGIKTPFIIYSGSRAREHRAEARRKGAIGCTNDPNQLFKMVVAALQRR